MEDNSSKTAKFYVVETEYVGPHDPLLAPVHYYDIQRNPGLTNLGRTVIDEGWLGTTQGMARHACGEYASEAEAEAAVREWGDVHRIDDVDGCDDAGEDIVARFGAGELPMISDAAATDVYYDADIAADTTDAKIDDLVQACLDHARDEGYTFDPDALRSIYVSRREKASDNE